jgi:hypothetical protein
MEFIELCEAICQSNKYDVLPTTLYNYLKNKYPWELPQDAYKGINILCKCENIELRHKLIKTLFDFYYNNPIDINKSRIIHTLITKVQDDYLIRYIAELYLTSNYDPVIFSKNDFENMAYWGMLDSIKFIFSLSEYDKYKNVMKNVNFLSMLKDGAFSGNYDVTIYLIKYIKKNKLVNNYNDNYMHFWTSRNRVKYEGFKINIGCNIKNLTTIMI